MTTTTMTPDRAFTWTPLGRLVAVARLQFTNPWRILILPWIILTGVLLLNMAIWWLILANTSAANQADAMEGVQYSGAISYAFIYMMVIAVQAISGYFPYAMGLSVTRRTYYAGTALAFVALSVAFSFGLSIYALIEEATGGWGLGGTMFTAVYFGSNPLERAFIFFAILMFFFFVGSAVASVYVRWRATGMTVFFGALALLIVGGLALVTLSDGWAAVGAWFWNNGLLGTYAWTFVITGLSALAGYLLLRRATPKS